jgi:hypothetical protein
MGRHRDHHGVTASESRSAVSFALSDARARIDGLQRPSEILVVDRLLLGFERRAFFVCALALLRISRDLRPLPPSGWAEVVSSSMAREDRGAPRCLCDLDRRWQNRSCQGQTTLRHRGRVDQPRTPGAPARRASNLLSRARASASRGSSYTLTICVAAALLAAAADQSRIRLCELQYGLYPKHGAELS